MRTVILVIAALVTLGLAAVGVVAAQKTSLASLPAAIAARASHDRATHAAQNNQVRVADASATKIDAPPVAGPATDRAFAQTSTSGQPAGSGPPAPVDAKKAPQKQNTSGPSLAAAGTSAAAAPSAISACDKPGGMGLARIVEIDTTGGPGFGFEHFKQYDFLRDKEVVLTFDDGPWPENTPAVLKALAEQCLKATFFEIGKHAVWHPEIVKEVMAGGNTVGTHTWSHKDLARNPYASDLEKAKEEIEMGVSAVHMAAGAPIAPFFRFPALQHPPALLSYLAERNIASFSTDIDSFDFKMRKPDQVIKSIMTKLDKRGKGIILMHDFQRNTGEAMPELLRQLKAGGYKVVHMVPRQPLQALPQYDEMVMKLDKLSVTNTRPTSSVVRTIGE